MSDIPSRLSGWEPPRALKIAFLAFAATCVVALFASKIFDHTVGTRLKLEMALQVQPAQGLPPDIALTDRQGKPFKLSDLRGKVVFVNFWATWCEPCRQEMPSLFELARTAGPDVVFVAATVDDSWEPVDAVFQGAQVPVQLVMDKDRALAGKLGTDKFPESFIIDRDGTLRYRIVGARDWGVGAARKLLQKL